VRLKAQIECLSLLKHDTAKVKFEVHFDPKEDHEVLRFKAFLDFMDTWGLVIHALKPHLRSGGLIISTQDDQIRDRPQIDLIHDRPQDLTCGIRPRMNLLRSCGRGSELSVCMHSCLYGPRTNDV
jgi:hypothetical protein